MMMLFKHCKALFQGSEVFCNVYISIRDDLYQSFEKTKTFSSAVLVTEPRISCFIGCPNNKRTLSCFLPRFDADRDGEMDKDEFLDFVYGSMLEQARILLKAGDEDDSGKLSKEELAEVFKQVCKQGRIQGYSSRLRVGRASLYHIKCRLGKSEGVKQTGYTTL